MQVELFALLEQIRKKQGLDTADEAIALSIKLTSRKLGILQEWNLNAKNQVVLGHMNTLG